MIDTHVELPDGEESLTFLEDALEFSGVSGVIVVQRESDQLANSACLELSGQSDGLVCGVVCWAPLADERLLSIQLDSDSRNPLVCGYVADIHQKNVADWVRDEDVHYGVGLLADSSKPLDLLAKPAQVRDLVSFLDAHPGLPIVLDHCFDPILLDDAWSRLMREIGRRPHVFYRLSGLAATACAETACEATERVKVAFDIALDAFGSKRLLYGSGWPATPARYPVWLNTVDNLIHSMSADERADIYGSNAEDVYKV